MARQRNTAPVIASIPDLGKVPPQALDMEEAVLGGVMLEKEAILLILDFVKPESFYKPAHQKIFEAVLTLYRRGDPIDLLTVTEELRANQNLDYVGGILFLTKLTEKVVSAANIEYHGRIIAQKWLQRELIRISTEIQTRAFDDSYDISELFEYAEKCLFELSGVTQKKQPKHLAGILDEVIKIADKIRKGEQKLVGIPSGIVKLDRYTAGFQKKELTIIAGRPSMGKTAFALQVAKNAAVFGNPVLIFSLEMPDVKLGGRYLSGASGKTNNEIQNGNCDIEELIKAFYILNKLPIYIDDTSAISVMEVRAKTMKFILEKGIRMIIVDYLQLMSGEGDTREQVIAGISRDLKAVAKDLDIPVIALSQLNRGVEQTSDKKPKLSDLRESGAIEQDADVVMFVYRPAKYGIKEIEAEGHSEDTRGLMDIIIEKNRSGPTGEIILRHNESITSIYEPEETVNLQTEGKPFTHEDPLRKLNPEFRQQEFEDDKDKPF